MRVTLSSCTYNTQACWGTALTCLHIILPCLQASDINALFGFRLECLERLGEAGVWAWTRMNALFNWLPLAALVEDRIMCMHGGELPDNFKMSCGACDVLPRL